MAEREGTSGSSSNMVFDKMFLSSFSVSCRCLALILIPVPVPGKELQGGSSQTLLQLLLLLNVVSAVPGDSPVPVSGFVGEQVVLPCTYEGNVSVSDLLVIWKTPKDEVLYEFIDGNDNLRLQDQRFRNRTNLFKDQLEHGNWSVLISDLKEKDQNQYVCRISEWTGVSFSRKKSHYVDLSVRERPPTPAPNTPVPDPGLSTGAGVGLGIGIATVFVVVGIVIYIIRKPKRWKCAQNRHSSSSNEASNGVPLSEVTCAGEARSLVPTAPEHQDGAAGQQNLLGNRAVQQ